MGIGESIGAEVRCDFGELSEGGLEVFDDVGGDDLGSGKIGAVFEGFVFQPENIQVDLVAFDQVFVFVGSPAAFLVLLRPGGLSFVAVLWIVAGDEVIEITALEGVFFEGEMQVGAQVVDPERHMQVRLALHGFSCAGLRSKKRTLAFTHPVALLSDVLLLRNDTRMNEPDSGFASWSAS